MKKWLIALSIVSSLLLMQSVFAKKGPTERIAQISNHKVTVWERIIPPNHTLATHRHDHDRVLIALTDGELEVSNNHGKTHMMKIKKDHAYYFAKDDVGSFHSDRNVTKHPIKVMVVELL